jgi:hypothetical protein
MATQIERYEQYPLWIVLLSNFVSISIYAIGGYIIYQLGFIWLVLYLLYVLLQEVRLLKGSCTNCYYYGKLCAFGQGRLSAVFFKKGNNPGRFTKEMTWKDLLPDLLVSLVPILVGTGILIMNFNFLILLLVILLVVLTSAGNGFVRGTLACKFCKQRELGCPAEKLFKKGK